MKNIIIRDMKLDDCPEVGRMVCASFRWAAEQEGFSAEEIDQYVQRRGSQEAIRTQLSEHRCWVASIAGRIVGLISTKGNEITRLYVDPSVLGNGVGKRLFEKAERFVAQDGHDELIAWAVFDSAIPFYEAMGMFKAGRKFDVLDKSEDRNTMLIKKSLRPVPDVVYHASAESGLEKLAPCESTHRQPWVYATTELAISAIFLNHEGGDLSCSSGLSNGEVYIYERWPGAFDARYEGKGGSIYELPGTTFQCGRTSFTGEVISEVAVPVLREIVIEDAKSYLIDLKSEEQLRIFMHDQRPSWIPEDDQDLVERVIQWSRGNLNSSSVRYTERYLPHLMGRIRQILNVSRTE